MDHIFRRLSFNDLLKLSPVSAVLVIVNVLVFIFGIYAQNVMGWDELIFEGGIHSVAVLDQGEYWRLITAGFIHADIIHILFNVGFGIYLISAGLERVIGSVRFSIIYFVGLIGSSIVVLYFTDDVQGSFFSGYEYIYTAGASGAIFAVIGALLFITFMRPDLLSANEAASIRQLVLINVIFTFAVSGISITGHLGGLLVGLLLGYVVIPQNRVIKDNDVYDYTNNDDNNWWEN